MDNRDRKITELTALWYKIVNIDHHKDCDCHWYISKKWSYGQEPIYIVEHYGYVFKKVESKPYISYKEAENFLTIVLNQAIQKEKKWAEDTIKSNSIEDYFIEDAKEVLKLIEEFEKKT